MNKKTMLMNSLTKEQRKQLYQLVNECKILGATSEQLMPISSAVLFERPVLSKKEIEFGKKLKMDLCSDATKKSKNEETIDINKLCIGNKVRYSFPNNGTDFDKEKCQCLSRRKTYTIRAFQISGYSTSIYLDEIPSVCFNSVMFSDVVKKSKKLKA